MNSSTTNQAPEIRADMTMTEVLTAFPGAQRTLFAAYHIGGCSACSFQPTETLAEVCKRNEDIDVNEAITTILASYESELSLSISPQDLQTALAGDDPPELIDIRTREEHNAVTIPNSRFFSADLQQEIFAVWEKDAPIVVFDHTGNRGPDAAAYFVGHGFANTRALVGGIDAWSQEIDPTVARYKLEFDPT